MKFILCLCALVVFAGCEFSQDPLANNSAAVRNGKGPEHTKPLPENPISKEALRIDAPDLIEGRIEQDIKFVISGRVLTEDVPFSVQVLNLAEFPGARFDSATGEFFWTPTKSDVMGLELRRFELKVLLVTEPTAKIPVIQTEIKKIMLVVFNNYDIPVIKSFQGPQKMLIGEKYTMDFTLDVRDTVLAEDITFIPWDCSTYYQKSISYLASVKSIEEDKKTPGHFTGQFLIDLDRAQGLNRGSYCVGFIVMSKFGKQSKPSMRTIEIEPRLKHSVISMDDMAIVDQGKQATYHFTIYDPSGIGDLTLTSVTEISSLMPGSEFECTSKSYRRFQLDCRVLVDTSQVKAGRYDVFMEVKNEDLRNKKSFLDRHVFRVWVQ